MHPHHRRVATVAALSLLAGLFGSASSTASPADSMFAVHLVRGPQWPAGASTVAELPRVSDHLAAMRRLFATGRLIAGGPEADLKSAFGLVRAASQKEAEALFATDPLVAAGQLSPEVREWKPALSQIDFQELLTELATPWEGETVDGDVVVRWRRSPALRAELETNVPATPPEVWRRWTTAEGLRSFLAPQAAVDLRPGGRYELVWSPEAPDGEKGTYVLSASPPHRLVLAWNAPLRFPEVRANHFDMEIRIDQLAPGESRVRIRLDGFKDATEWRQAFDYFLQADAHVLNRTRQSLVEGPVSWDPPGSLNRRR